MEMGAPGWVFLNCCGSIEFQGRKSILVSVLCLLTLTLFLERTTCDFQKSMSHDFDYLFLIVFSKQHKMNFLMHLCIVKTSEIRTIHNRKQSTVNLWYFESLSQTNRISRSNLKAERNSIKQESKEILIIYDSSQCWQLLLSFNNGIGVFPKLKITRI